MDNLKIIQPVYALDGTDEGWQNERVFDCSNFEATIAAGETPYLYEMVCPLMRIVNVAMLVVGGVFVIYIIYGAIKAAMAYGDPKQTKGAYQTWTFAGIGLAVILFALVGVRIVFSALGYSVGLDSLVENLSRYMSAISHPYKYDGNNGWTD